LRNLLSVVITVYNEEKFVAECIESVINQTYSNLEIIIVDDGSSDGSLSICNSYIDKDSRIKVVAKENGGPMSARKAGIKVATGEYITYVDGDDRLDRDLYSSIMAKLDDSDIFVYGLTCVYNDENNPDNSHKEYMINALKDGVYEGEELNYLKSNSLYSSEKETFGVLPSMCSKVFRKELIEQNLYEVDDDVRMGDDGCCTFPSIWDAKKIIIDNSILGYLYRKNVEGTITSSYKFEEFNRIEKVFETHFRAYSNRKASNMLDQLVYYLAFLYRNEMVYELANLRMNNIITKLSHLFKIRKLEWVKYIVDNITYDKMTEETELLVKNIKHPIILMIKWYGKRALS